MDHQQPSFKSSALAVRVDVLVTDGRKPVGGLTAADFELRDNGVPQAISIVDAADVALNVALALDVSGSTRDARLADLVAASESLLDGLSPADRAALVTFSHAVRPRVRLTGDIPLLRAELRRMTSSGRTALIDAAYVALASTLDQPGRALVVVFTEGSDISSWLDKAEVLEAAKRANAVMYAVTTADARHVAPLSEIVDATGGDTIRVGSTAEVRNAFDRILRDFRSRYVLAYTPAGVPRGGFHRIEVRVKRRGLIAIARPGYVGIEGAR